MKKIILSLSVVAFLACGNQKTVVENSENSAETTVEHSKTPQLVDNQIKKTAVKASKEQSSPLLAKANISLEEFESGRNKAWFEPKYTSYAPSEEEVEAFKKAMAGHDYQIDVYMGLWCPDSRRETPRLYKLLKMIDFDLENLSVVTVNHSKQVPNVTPEVAKQLNIRYVPTIIFYENGKEVERFVESPRESLVQDLTNIANGLPYKDSREQ